MATFMDLGIFSGFSIIFTFLLVFVIVYGLLEFSKPFGKNTPAKGWHAMIAVSIGALVMFSPAMVVMINYMVPWFLIIVLIAFFILFVLRVFTGDSVDFSKAVTANSKIYTWVIVLTLVIVIFGLGKAFGSETLEKGNWGGTTAPTTDNDNDGTISSTEEFIGETGVGNNNVDGSNVATNDFETNLMNTLFNPKVLGLILIMLVGVFAIFFLTD